MDVTFFVLGHCILKYSYRSSRRNVIPQKPTQQNKIIMASLMKKIQYDVRAFWLVAVLSGGLSFWLFAVLSCFECACSFALYRMLYRMPALTPCVSFFAWLQMYPLFAALGAGSIICAGYLGKLASSPDV